MAHCHFQCFDCGRRTPCRKTYPLRCARCHGILDIVYPDKRLPGPCAPEQAAHARFPDRLPLEAGSMVSLGEGDTPLLQHHGIYLKDETRNPTGSFKDRPVAMALSYIRWCGGRDVITASSGNTAISVCHYGAHCGFRAVCYVPRATDARKQAWIRSTGAVLRTIDGDFAAVMRALCAEAADEAIPRITTTHFSPVTTEANKLIAYEIHRQLAGGIPDWILMPVGAGPLLTGIFKGFREINRGMPRLVAVQAQGCAPIVRAFLHGQSHVRPWEGVPETVAHGIADTLQGYPEDGTLTLRRIVASKGCAVSVSDGDILHARKQLRAWGIHAEPTGAAGYAGFLHMQRRGAIADGDTVVVVITGGDVDMRLDALCAAVE